jgi:hypothetical protein
MVSIDCGLRKARRSAANAIVASEPRPTMVSPDLENMQKLGRALANHVISLQESNKYSAITMQAIAADLIGTSGDLLIPTKDLLARPNFSKLVKFAGTGGGSIHRDVLLNELEKIYGTQTLYAMNELMNAFLGIASRNATKSELSSRPVKKHDVTFESREARRTRRVWSMLPVDNDESAWRQPSALEGTSAAPAYLMRRASSKPFNIARAVFLFPPLALVFGVRQRSWRLGLIPLCTTILVVALLDRLFQMFSLGDSWNLISSLSAATIACNVAYRIAKQNMQAARQLFKG